MARTKTKMSPKKMVAAITATTLAAVMLIGGAWAWTDFSQSAINRSRGIASPDVLLHDDFADEWIGNERQKDVYVENTGDIDTIVRIRFSEFLQIGNDKVVGTNSKDPKTWGIHTFNPGLPGHDASKAHEYFSWKMDGEDKVYLTDTSERGYFEYDETDYTFTPASAPKAPGVVYSDEKGPNGQPYSKTLPAADVVSMAYYAANKGTVETNAPNGCWIVDTDGWCYWSKTLKPGEATNMLLSSIEMIKNPNDNYAYNIYVDLQACNATEIGDMIGKGMTQKAEDNLINGLAGLIKIDAINFPDPVFRDAVSNGFTNYLGVETFAAADKNGDGKLSETERNAVTGVNLAGESVTNKGSLTSLKGIENFSNLRSILVRYNNITELDLTQLPCLVSVNAFENNISPKVDFSQCPDVYFINLGGNPLLSELIIPTTRNLTNLHVDGNSLLDDTDYAGWDIPNQIHLEALNIGSTGITSVDLTNNLKLKEFYANGASLGSIDVSNNEDLLILYVSNANLSTIDVSNNPKLFRLQAVNNLLTTMDLSNNMELQYITLYDNSSLSTLNLGANTKITQVHVQRCAIGSLDVSKTAVTTLANCRIENNGMTSFTINAIQQTAGFGTGQQATGNTLAVTVAP